VNLARRLFTGVSLGLTQQLVSVVGGIVVARIMGPVAIGILAAASASFALFNYVGNLGLGTAHMKHLAEGLDPKECQGFFIPADFVLSLIATLLGVLVYYVSINNGSVNIIPTTLFIIIGFGYFANQLTAIPRSTFLGLNQMVKRDLPFVIGQVVTTCGRVFVAVSGYGVYGLAYSDLVGRVIALIIYSFLLVPIGFKRPPRKLVISYLKYSMIFLIGGLLMAIARPIDTVMLNWYQPLATIGLYSVALRFTVPLTKAVSMMSPILYPAQTKAHQVEGTKGILRFIKSTEKGVGLIAGPIMILSAAFGGKLITLILGSNYSQSQTVFVLLIWTAVIKMITNPASQYLSLVKKKALFIWSIAIDSAVTILLIYIAAKGFAGRVSSAEGILFLIGCAKVLSATIGIPVYYLMISKGIKERVSNGGLWIIFLSIFLGSVVLFLATVNIPIIAVLVVCFVAIVLYYKIMDLVKVVSKNDFVRVYKYFKTND